MAATRTDWKIRPLPAARKSIALDRKYTAEEFARIKDGLVPECTEDHWFFFYEEPWLYCHRSWTGICIYHVRFESIAERFCIAEVLANRDADEYGETDDIADSLLLGVLLDQRAGRDTAKEWDQYARRLGKKD